MCGQTVLSIAFLSLESLVWKWLVPGKRGGVGSYENCEGRKKGDRRLWTGLWAPSPQLEGL